MPNLLKWMFAGMKKREINMTEGPLASQILLFSLPLVLSNLLQVLFNMSDIAVVGRFAGKVALGCVGSTATLVTLFTTFLIGVAGGVNVMVAQYLGARKDRDVKETVSTAFWLCLALGIFVSVFGIFGAKPILQIMNTKEEFIKGATLYVQIYFLGMPALALYNFGNAVFSAAGETKKPLYFLTIAGAVNIVLNVLFVIGFKLSVVGVALASVISQYVAAVLVIIALSRVEENYGVKLKNLPVHRAKLSDLVRLGLPAGLQNAIFQFANLFVQVGVNSFDAVIVEGNSAATNADGLVYDVMAAFYIACASFMGQNYGAKNKKRVRDSFIISLIYSFGSGLLIGVTLTVFGRQFLSLFATEPEVIDAGMMRLGIMGLCYGFSAFMDCTIAASRGLGKTVVPTFIVIMGSCVFRVIWIYTIFAYFKTVPSLYLLYIFSWSFTAVAEFVYFIRIYKKQVASLGD